jgi:hypothetical protein
MKKTPGVFNFVLLTTLAAGYFVCLKYQGPFFRNPKKLETAHKAISSRQVRLRQLTVPEFLFEAAALRYLTRFGSLAL